MSNKNQSAKGLQFPRQFTKAGTSPYDMFEYDYRTSVIKNTSGEIVFQMDKTEPAHQAFLRYVRERGEDTNLDCGVRLCARRHHKKGSGARRLALHFFTDSVGSLFRENPIRTGTFRWRTHFAIHGVTQPDEFVR